MARVYKVCQTDLLAQIQHDWLKINKIKFIGDYNAIHLEIVYKPVTTITIICDAANCTVIPALGRVVI